MAGKTLVGLFLAILQLVLAGCIQSKTVLTVRKDGSGTLEHTAYQKISDVPGGPADDKNPFDEKTLPEKCAQSAKDMGEGVTFKSAAQRTDKKGWHGAKILYEVKDISKLTVGFSPPLGNEMPQDKENRFKFELAGNKITVAMPEMKPDNKGADDKKLTPEEEKMQDGMMAQMFTDMLIEFELNVEGAIEKTNASSVKADKKGVVLTRQDMGGLIKDADAFKKFKGMDKIKEAKELKKLFQDADIKKHFQIDPSEKVEIEFK